MKKFSKILAMVMVALMMMSTMAFAAAIEDPTVEDKVVTVQLTGLTANEEATILVVNDGATLASLANNDIVYIDQLTVANDGTVTFTLDAVNAAENEKGEKYVDIYCGYTNMDVAAGPLTCADLLINPVDAPDVVYGDINGDGSVTTADAGMALQHYASLITLVDNQFVAADVNGDGAVTTADGGLILQYYASIISSFPVENAGN